MTSLNGPTSDISCQVSHPDPIAKIIPAGGINLLAGQPGVGKTALIAWMAQLFRDQQPVFGHDPAPLPAIGVVNADRSWQHGAGYWFDLLGYADVRHYSMADDPNFDPRILRRKFERPARLFEFVDRLQLPPGSLLFCDPVGLFLGGNLLDYDSCAVACHEIRVGIRTRGLTVIGTAHSAKIKSDRRERYLRLQDQILGSTALFGFTDTQMVLASPEETGRRTYTFLWHPHIAPIETFDLERDKEGRFYLAEIQEQESILRVLHLFPDDFTELKLKTLILMAQAIPLSRITVIRALQQLVKAQLIWKVRHGVYCRVPRM